MVSCGAPAQRGGQHTIADLDLDGGVALCDILDAA
jgi:hypothetical protein